MFTIEVLQAKSRHLFMLGKASNLSANRGVELDAAIEGLYSTFAHKHHGPVTGCSDCTSPADDERLGPSPCHLTGEDLSRFASKAVTTLETVHDLKHFLPRLLQIASQTGDVGGTDFEIVLGKLAYAEWARWPDFRTRRDRAIISGVMAFYPRRFSRDHQCRNMPVRNRDSR